MDVDALRDQLNGTVLLPGDEGWDQARAPWNPRVDQHPAAIVHAVSVDDVVATVRYAAQAGVPVSVQPRGHGATTALDGTIVLRTGALDELEVDAAARTARIGAGVPWGRVMAALDGTGLVALAGSHPGVTAVSYLLGGGLSWFGRAFGTGAASVRAVELVTPSGEVRRLTDGTADGTSHAGSDGDGSDADLLWALRGGGGDFGVVTAVEIDLFEAPSLYGGRLVLPGEVAGAALRTFAEVTRSAPDTATVWVSAMSFPPAPQLPEEIRGKTFTFVDSVHIGEAGEAEAFLAPFRALGPVLRDTMRPLPPGEVGTVAEEPETAPAGVQAASAAVPLTRFDEEVVDALMARTGPGRPLGFLGVRHLGGALARGPQVRTGEDGRAGQDGRAAAGRVDAAYLLVTMGMAPDAERLAAAQAAVDDLRTALAPATGGTATLTFVDGDRPLSDVHDAATIARLQAVKRSVDPSGVIRSNHPVLAG